MLTDSDTTTELQLRMSNAVAQMTRMTGDVANARQVREFNSDRLKRAFSVLVVEELKCGKSVAAAEHAARASDSYGTTLNDLSEQYRTAIATLERYEAFKTQYEAARSLLSAEKAKMAL